MTTRAMYTVRIIVGILAGAAGLLALAALWHGAGLVTQPVSPSYAYTEYFTHCVSWSFTAAYFALNMLLGLLLRRNWPIALGMIIPLAVALLIEMRRDPTGHNLFPFEIIMVWMPVFGVAWLAASLGEMLVTRRSRPPVIQSGPPR